MTINLPNDLESSIQATVRNGRFASVDDAMAEAARLLLRELARLPQTAKDAGNSGLDRSAPCETMPICSTRPLSTP